MDLKPSEIQQIYGDTFYLVKGDGQGEEESTAATAEKEAPAAVSQPAEKQAPPVKPVEKAAPQAPAATAPTGAITWRPKPTSQVLFIVNKSEIADKELGALLKKIVASIGIPFESAGFGIVKGTPNMADFQQMPNPFGVVFDTALQPGGSDNPLKMEAGSLFFCNTLTELRDNQDHKRTLWNYLKALKEQLT